MKQDEKVNAENRSGHIRNSRSTSEIPAFYCEEWQGSKKR